MTTTMSMSMTTSTSTPTISTSTSLLDLPFEDILFAHVLPSLSLKDLFSFRQVSGTCLRLVNHYFAVCRTVDLREVQGHRFTESPFQVITESCTLLTTLVLPNSKWLTDGLLFPVLDSNPGLVVVDFSGCTGITGESVKMLAGRCPHLTKLILRDCYWLTAAELIVVALNCSRLHFVDLTSCWQVDDDSVCALVERCPKLKYISLAKIYGITNAALIAVAYHCRRLCHLDVVGCWRITDDGVKIIGEYCRDLKTLRVCECRDISERSLGALRAYVNVDLPLVPYPYNRAIFLRELGLNVQN